MEQKEKNGRRNRLYTLSYFRKRLHDVNRSTEILVGKYNEEDKRYWTIMIDKCIVCTCFKYVENNEHKVYFHFSDGGQKIAFDVRKVTESMQVIIQYLDSILGVKAIVKPKEEEPK